MKEPLLAFRRGFISAFDWQSGVMEGEIDHFYSGGEHSDDEKYPYSRKRFENASTGRVVEKGRPGKTFAIVGSVPLAERHTDRFTYSKNDLPDFMPELPAGRYFQAVQTDPDGYRRVRLQDLRESDVAQGIEKEGGGFLTTAYQVAHGPVSRTETTLLPNFFDPPGGESVESFKVIGVYDLLERKTRSEAPDSGALETVFDLLGSLRFSQDGPGFEVPDVSKILKIIDLPGSSATRS